jgi:hypothetical protein
MHQVVSSMSQPATTGAAGAGATVATAGSVTFSRHAGGPKTGTGRSIRQGLVTLR